MDPQLKIQLAVLQLNQDYESMKLKSKIRSVARKILAPFKRLGRKIKITGERFVIKTVAKHGLVSYQNTVSQDGTECTLSQPLSQGSIKVMLAFLQASRPTTSCPVPQFEAIPTSNGRFLVRHPLVGHMFADSADIQALPLLALNQYQEQNTIAIERHCSAGAHVLHLCAGQGFHTLSIADIVGESGKVFVIESRSQWLPTLRMNIDSHKLEHRVFVAEPEVTSALCFERFLETNTAKKIIVFDKDEVLSNAWQESLVALATKAPSIMLLIGEEAMSIAEYVKSISIKNFEPSLQHEKRLAA